MVYHTEVIIIAVAHRTEIDPVLYMGGFFAVLQVPFVHCRGRLPVEGYSVVSRLESQREVAQEGRSGFEAAMWDQADAYDEDMEEGSTTVKVGSKS